MKICIVPVVPRKRREALSLAIKKQLGDVVMSRVVVAYGPPGVSHESSLAVARSLGVNTSVESCLANPKEEADIRKMLEEYSGARRGLNALVVMAPSNCMVNMITRCGVRNAGGQLLGRMTASSGKLVVINGSGEVSLVGIQ